MDLTLEHARAAFVTQAQRPDDLVWHRAFVETEEWWIVLYGNRAVYETGNPLLELVEIAPFVVPKDGSAPFRPRTDTSIKSQLADRGPTIGRSKALD